MNETNQNAAPFPRPTILSAECRPIISFGDLFEIFDDGNGKLRAELGRATAPIALQLAWKIDEATSLLVWAFLLSTENSEPGGNLRHITGDLLHSAVAPEIKILADRSRPLGERERARAVVEKRISSALDALFQGAKRSPHKKAGTVVYPTADGSTREVSLAWAVLECARTLVEETQSLPTKRDVRRRVERDFPVRSLVQFSDSQWSAAFKEAGLAELPRAADW